MDTQHTYESNRKSGLVSPPESLDAHLAARRKCGDAAAISELFEKHHRVLLAIARRILSSQTQAEDAVQSAYCSALQHLHTFRGESSFKTWMSRIVVNQCLVTIRESWRRVTANTSACLAYGSLERVAANSPSPEKLAWCEEIASAYERALSKLPASLRTAYSMHADSGMPVNEIAQALGITLSAAKTRVFRARIQMQASLANLRTHSRIVERGTQVGERRYAGIRSKAA